MKSFFVFSSPYLYYMENLKPLADELESQGHKVYFSYSLHRNIGPNYKEYVLKGKVKNLLQNFLNGKVKVDAVLLTQCWWLSERRIVAACKKMGIPFYVLDHAPQMLIYDSRRARYRSSTKGARAHFMWGKASKDVMVKTGCEDRLPIGGSPRIDCALEASGNSGLKSKYGKKIISLYTTSNVMSSKYFENQFEEIQRWAASHGEYSLVIKKHPRFSVKSSLKRIINPDICKIFEEQSFEDNIGLIKASDLIAFSFPSSMMIPASILNKKIISLYGRSNNKNVKKYAETYKDGIFNYIGGSFDQIDGWSPDLNSLKRFANLNLFRPKEGSAKYLSRKILADL